MLPGDEGQRLNVYTAQPDTATAEALGLLASWTSRRPIELIRNDDRNEGSWNA